MNQITITISGPVGVGKSSIAGHLAGVLKSHDISVGFDPNEGITPGDRIDIEDEETTVQIIEKVDRGDYVAPPQALEGHAFVSFDVSTAETDKAVRAKLIEMGWTPPKDATLVSGVNPDGTRFHGESAIPGNNPFTPDIYEAAAARLCRAEQRGRGARQPDLPGVEPVLDAPGILAKAMQHMRDRAAARDVEGERSMARCVQAFNALTGANISERDGWLFMVVLKMARATAGSKGTLDDYEDGAAYFALAGESITKESKA